LVERRHTSLADDLVLGIRAARTTDRTDDCPLTDEWNASSRRDDSIERQQVVELHELNTVFEDFGWATERSGGARFMFRYLNRGEHRAIHSLEGNQMPSGIGQVERCRACSAVTAQESEPAVGSAWIQFDLRFYVVALLFVIFDVEVAFFFPWATVFGKANQLANLEPPPPVVYVDGKEKPLTEAQEKVKAERMRLSKELMPTVAPEGRGLVRKNPETNKLEVVPIDPESASAWARVAFYDLLVFFGVLMVGFAYVWRRGDIDWVRAYAPHHEPATPPQKPLEEKAVA